ncbi:MAG: hypothetical protein GWN16_12720, partial [Calditrichae bacterium]|nr:hypothetical protein [Calditrichia bacterium]NIW80257.1 hypothetical protein [Calditrichia bacterium]
MLNPKSFHIAAEAAIFLIPPVHPLAKDAISNNWFEPFNFLTNGHAAFHAVTFCHRAVVQTGG